MNKLWFDHLSSGLSRSGLIAYIWHVGQDRIEWAGDIAGVLGSPQEDCPQTNKKFNEIINPQYIPYRLGLLHELLAEAEGNEQASRMATYKMRRANGAHLEVEESMSLSRDAQNERIVCGFIRVVDSEQLLSPGASGVQKITGIMPDRMSSSSGRSLIQEKIEAWQADNAGGLENFTEGYLLVAGIDRLTLMNEAFGARYSDELIEKTGERLTRIAGDNGSVSRIDGDVFAIFFPRAHHHEMTAVAQHILNNFFDVPLETSKGPVGVSISMGGIRLSPQMREDSHSLIAKAEMAMRSAKERGRNCFVPYDKNAGHSKNSRLLLDSGDAFLRALKESRVMLAFQPVKGTRSQNVSFHESLIRMIGDDGNLVAASDFVPAIEKLGLSRLVDQYALRMALNELRLFPDLTLSVNVSNLTLANPDWLRGIVSSLRDHPSIARRLIIEITESAATHDMQQTIRIVKTLKDLGCRVALDDFGAGYTAFAQIKDLDVDLVKIDKSFIRNNSEEQNQLFVRTLHSLANGVNVETVGEGAETMDDARRLASDGIDHIQGYVYGFPQVERIWLPKDHTHRQIIVDPAHQDEEYAVLTAGGRNAL